MGNQLTSIELPDDLRSKVDCWRKANKETLRGAIIKALQLLLKKEEEATEYESLTDGEIVECWRGAESTGIKPLDLLAVAIKERRLSNEN